MSTNNAAKVAAGIVPANPRTKVLRSALQFLGGLAALLVIVLPQIPTDSLPWPWLAAGIAGALAIATGFTRLMAIPQVNEFLDRWLPALATKEVAVDQVQSVTDNTGPTGALAAAGADLPTGMPVEPPQTIAGRA